jgi:chromosome segregation ATPase
LLDQQHGRIQEALDRRDAKIEDLRREIEIKLGLKAKLARAQREIAEARAQAPNFKTELDGLREKVAKQEKLITRLRGQASQLEFGQRKLESAQHKDRREATLTVTKLTTFGQQTRTVLEALRENGFEFDLGEMESPSRWAS